MAKRSLPIYYIRNNAAAACSQPFWRLASQTKIEHHYALPPQSLFTVRDGSALIHG
jgi:hypothetical protein